MNNNKIEATIKYYKLCTKLKDTIRKGPTIWNAKRDRIESVAEHIWGHKCLLYLYTISLSIN